MSEYMIIDSQFYNTDELYHYGVKGMRWGVIRAQKSLTDRGISKRQSQNERLEKRAAKYDVKVSKRALKNVKRGIDEPSLIATKKSAKLGVKAAKLERKTVDMDPSDRKYLTTKRKAAKTRLKSLEAMNVSELASKKDYKYQINSAKARYKIEKNNLKLDALSDKSIELGRQLMAAED